MRSAAGLLPNSALRIGALALVALLVLQIVWHAWLAPPPSARWLPTLLLALVPLLLALWTCIGNLRRGVLIGGMLGLFYFCHGIADVWSGDAPRWLAAAEVALTLLLIGALGWDARSYRRKKI